MSLGGQRPIQAIDGIYGNVGNMAGFEKGASDAKCMGFDGNLNVALVSVAKHLMVI